MPNDNLDPNRPNARDGASPPAGRPMPAPPRRGTVNTAVDTAVTTSASAFPPLTDREVPVPARHETPAVVQEWLDGEATSSMVKATQGGEDAVDLWKRINNEAELLRTRTTPLYVHKRIMESLPDDLHRVDRPWYRRSVALNPIALVAAAAALIGAGVLIARAITH